jgi:hypothetical protein
LIERLNDHKVVEEVVEEEAAVEGEVVAEGD